MKGELAQDLQQQHCDKEHDEGQMPPRKMTTSHRWLATGIVPDICVASRSAVQERCSAGEVHSTVISPCSPRSRCWDTIHDPASAATMQRSACVCVGGGVGCSCCSVALVAPVPPFPFSVALCVVREKELREPVDGGPKTVMWCSEPAGDRWHCRLGPGTVSRSPGWAIGWTGQCSPAPQPWAVCPVEGGGGSGLHFTLDRLRAYARHR